MYIVHIVDIVTWLAMLPLERGPALRPFVALGLPTLRRTLVSAPAVGFCPVSPVGLVQPSPVADLPTWK